jgi:hypothetical protein
MRRVNIHRGASQYYDESSKSLAEPIQQQGIIDPDAEPNLVSNGQAGATTEEVLDQGQVLSDALSDELREEGLTGGPPGIARQTHDNRTTDTRQSHDRHTTIARQTHDKSSVRKVNTRQSHDNRTTNRTTDTRQKQPSEPPSQASKKRGKKQPYKTTPKPFDYDLLRRPERGLFHLFAESCGTGGSLVTKPFHRSDIAKALALELRTLEQVIRRLRLKAWLPEAQREDTRSGPGGFAVYRMYEPILKIVHLRITNEGGNRTTIARQSHDKTHDNHTTAAPSSSSYIETNFKPTTTAESETRARADNVWTPENLDYSMLADIGFGRSQALQLRSLGLSFDVVQSSLVYFDFELRHTASGKSIQAPLALLMKRLRQNGCWEAPEEYTKRREHFRSRFDERENGLHTSERQGATSGEDDKAGPEVAEDQP